MNLEFGGKDINGLRASKMGRKRRFKYGLLAEKPRKSAYIYDSNGRRLSRKHVIVLYDDDLGKLLDGRPVKKINGKWRLVSSWWD